MTRESAEIIEQDLLKMDPAITTAVFEDFTDVHDVRKRVGQILRKLDMEGSVSYSSKEDFKFSDHVAAGAWDYSSGHKPPAKAMDLRRVAVFFATLSDAFSIIEKSIEKSSED